MYHIIMQTILYNNFYGSVADTNTHMRVWDCAYAENVDGRSEPECLKLNREVIVYQSVQSLPIAMYDWYIFCKDWHIYNIYWASLPSQIWVSELITVARFWLYGIAFAKTSWWNIELRVCNIIITPITWSITRWNFTPFYWDLIDPITWSLTWSFSVPYYWWNISFINHSEDILYFSIEDKVYIMDYQFVGAGVIKQSLIFEARVIWLTRDANSISIYLQNWRKYFWWWIWYETPDGYSDLWISRITHVWTAKNVDYISWVWTSTRQKILFLCQWQQTQQLAQSNNLQDWTDRKNKFPIWSSVKNDFWLWYNHNLVFFPFDATSQWAWFLSLWIQNSVTPYWFLNEFVSDLYDSVWLISFARDWFWLPKLYVWVSKVSWWYDLLEIDYTPNNYTPTYQSEWVRYTKKEINQAPQQNRIKKYYFRYDLPAWTNIDIYYALNWSSNYTLLTSLPSDQLDHYFDQSMFWNRHEIQHKIVLRSTNNLETPRLYSMAITTEETRRGISSQ